ncbi:hypothetical protein [Phenylobacterium sp. J367]|uniref:amidohydrolase family protein n=1 Tax=Phenylobacterium sp. J367 TaxID=2898435 RepID=UPI0021512BCF|nr:hypothetical protein [Phenylobacterium sp. J367]MCR5880948.1 hypothetical protein [Phenylobacterium sp. J367]
MRNERALKVAGALAAAILVGSAAEAQGPSAGVTAIMGATVFPATGAEPFVANVVIRDGRIAEVGPKVRAPRGATVIDAKGKALLPGFFDLHTHWTPNGQPNITPEIANAYIAAGVTTVNDFHQSPGKLGAPPPVAVDALFAPRELHRPDLDAGRPRRRLGRREHHQVGQHA